MKKIIFLLYYVLTIGLWFASCTIGNDYEDGPTESGKNLQVANEFKAIGRSHNQGLEAAFTQLRSCYTAQTRNSGNTKPYSKEEILRILKQGVSCHCNKQETRSIQTDRYINDTLYTYEDLSSKVSQEVYNLLEEIKSEISNTGKTPKQLVELLNGVAAKASQTLLEEECQIVYSCISTWYYSYLYWKENHMKWIIALNKPELISQYDDELLNQFNIHKGELIYPDSVTTRGVWDDFCKVTGEAWDSTSDAISNWWNSGGEEIVIADGIGALLGALEGSTFGVAGAATGAIEQGCIYSIEAAANELIKIEINNR